MPFGSIGRRGTGMLDETNLFQRLGAEAIGTAFLVFIGVGSVPATLIVNGDAPFTMADLGMISMAFGTVVIATVYALGHIGGNHINPAVTLGLAASGKFPWSQVPAYVGAQVVGAIVGAAAIIGVRGQHPGRPDDGRLHQPRSHVRPDAGPAGRRRRREVGPAAGLPGRRAPRRCCRGAAVRPSLPDPGRPAPRWRPGPRSSRHRARSRPPEQQCLTTINQIPKELS